MTLPTFDEARCDALRQLELAKRTLQSDWQAGHGPQTMHQAACLLEALRCVLAAMTALDRAAEPTQGALT